jgi:hypothetical protein
LIRITNQKQKQRGSLTDTAGDSLVFNQQRDCGLQALATGFLRRGTSVKGKEKSKNSIQGRDSGKNEHK